MTNIATWEEGVAAQDWQSERYDSIATEPQSMRDPAWEKCIVALSSALSMRDDDGLTMAPNRSAIEFAIGWVEYLRSKFPEKPPTLITPEPTGGVIIERYDRLIDGTEELSQWTIYNDRTSETAFYRNGRIVWTSPRDRLSEFAINRTAARRLAAAS